MAKKGVTRHFGPVSHPLEEDIQVNFKVIGTKEWLEECFEKEALKEDEVICYNGKPSSLKPILDNLRVEKYLGVDTETNSVDPISDTSEILMMQIGTPNLVYVVQPDLIRLFEPILESSDITHILQNAVFDYEFIMHKCGVYIGKMYDTMLAEQVLTSGLMAASVSLEDIVRKHPPHRIISKEIRKQFVEFNGVFSRQMVYYAVKDVVLLEPVMHEQIKLLDKHKLSTVANHEFEVIPCTAMMEMGGVNLDIRVLRLALTYWEMREKELEEQILNMYDDEIRKTNNSTLWLLPNMKDTFDIKSPMQKLQALRNIGLDIEDTRRETLEDLDSPIARLLAEYSEVIKVTSTYGENMIRKISPETGRFHPEFHQLGMGESESKSGKAKKGTIATGRYSSDFQQLPRPVARYTKLLEPELTQAMEQFGGRVAEILGRNPDKEKQGNE